MKSVPTTWMATTPCDGPFIASDYVKRLWKAAIKNQTSIAVAYCHGRLQPVYTLLKTDLVESLSNYLESGERKIDRWYEQVGYCHVDFSDYDDMFLNINTEQELVELEKNHLKP